MKEHPIIFNSEMVKAILDGRKTQTRRVVKPSHIKASRGCVIKRDFTNKCRIIDNTVFTEMYNVSLGELKQPFGQVGDRLWVRETFRLFNSSEECTHYEPNCSCSQNNGKPMYKASVYDDYINWKPSIHMPRWASRINLEITDIRVEELQDITFEDCVAEGIIPPRRKGMFAEDETMEITLEEFISLWNSVNKKHTWESNPYVWVIEFRRLEK